MWALYLAAEIGGKRGEERGGERELYNGSMRRKAPKASKKKTWVEDAWSKDRKDVLIAQTSSVGTP